MKLVWPLLLLVVPLACAPTYHRVQSYRFDPAEADDLELEKAQACEEAAYHQGVPDRRFVTDGCTLWPDGWWTGRSWSPCCVDHDAAYWCGGTAEARRDADAALGECVAEAYSGWMGGAMWLGTRVMGHPLVPAHWRWGYGHDYPSSY